MTKTPSPPGTRPAPTDGLSWETIAGNALAALLSGLVSGALDALFGRSASDRAELRKLLQEFADDIVRRVTVNVREEIRTAIFEENMRQLAVLATVTARCFRRYKSTEQEQYLLEAELHGIETVAEAESLGLPALGIHVVYSSAMMAILLERKLPHLAVEEIERAKLHLKMLQQLALDRAAASVGEPRRTAREEKRNPWGPDPKYYLINVNGQDRRVEVPEGSDSGPALENHRENLIAEQQEIIADNLIAPSDAIIEMWDMLSAQLSSDCDDVDQSSEGTDSEQL